MIAVQAQPQAGQETAQQAIPDAPRPQTTLPDANSITPGEGTTSTSSGDGQPVDSTPAPVAAPAPVNQTPTYEAPVGTGEDAIQKLVVNVDAVDVAFTVKDSKGHLVPGLTAREVQVYENGVLQHIQLFTNEALPMSVALVIDQSMTQDEMIRVNDAHGRAAGCVRAKRRGCGLHVQQRARSR